MVTTQAKTSFAGLGIASAFKQAMKSKGLIACIAQTTSPVGRLNKYLSNYCGTAHFYLTAFRSDVINTGPISHIDNILSPEFLSIPFIWSAVSLN
jgi:hypothetical protein